MPKEMAHSHLGMATDGRYIYVVTGQYGPQCRGPTAHTFVLDTETRQWQDMPPLPVPRYFTFFSDAHCDFCRNRIPLNSFNMMRHLQIRTCNSTLER